MSVIHRTTLTPTKLELLTSWLPTQPWYTATEHAPELTRSGGFRLDDPRGEVGIEFLVVTDVSGDRPFTYHVPLTYRGAPLAGAEPSLVGTLEHGVLGRRWVYDGTGDPVLLAQLVDLLRGRAEPQAQSVSDTPDHSVRSHLTGEPFAAASAVTALANGPHGTDLVVDTPAEADASGAAGRRLTLHVVRVLRSEESSRPAGSVGAVTADWGVPGGATSHSAFVVLRDETP